MMVMNFCWCFVVKLNVVVCGVIVFFLINRWSLRCHGYLRENSMWCEDWSSKRISWTYLRKCSHISVWDSRNEFVHLHFSIVSPRGLPFTTKIQCSVLKKGIESSRFLSVQDFFQLRNVLFVVQCIGKWWWWTVNSFN